MFCRISLLIATSSCALWLTACVSVDTPDTKVKVGTTSLRLPGDRSSSSETPAYAKPLKRVTAQQAKVARELAKQDWKDLVSESSDWITRVRDLTGYAGSSQDPALFQACCEELVLHAQALREAALRRDATAARQSLAACDPPLNRLNQAFPLGQAGGHAATASPAARQVPPSHPSSQAEPRPTAGARPLVP